MTENVFEAVKQSVSTRDAAAFYGIEVKRNGMACCPFHDDKNPSMKLNEEYFYCFGCGATGDVIDFAAKLFDLSPKEAAEKLAQDFGLIYDSQAPPRRRYVRQKTEAQQFREDVLSGGGILPNLGQFGNFCILGLIAEDIAGKVDIALCGFRQRHVELEVVHR